MPVVPATRSIALPAVAGHDVWLGYAVLGIAFALALASLAAARFISLLQRR